MMKEIHEQPKALKDTINTYVKDGKIDFIINDLPVFSWQDDGKEYGPVLGGGKIGFRQMAPMIGEYSNLKVYSI